MVALFLLLIVMVDTALTGYLFAVVRQLRADVASTATLLKAVCEEDSSDGE